MKFEFVNNIMKLDKRQMSFMQLVFWTKRAQNKEIWFLSQFWKNPSPILQNRLFPQF